MSLLRSLPWIKKPLIIGAPMGGVATASLATAVTNAGGLGMIGTLGSIKDIQSQLAAASASLSRTADGFLPIGLGILSCFMFPSSAEVVEVLKEHKPLIVWLFGAFQNSHYAEWAQTIRASCPKGTQVWVQVGSVASAVEIARLAKPDAISVQGTDAGGHGLEAGAGIVSLFPEVKDALEEAGFSTLPLVAAGGIVDGRGAAAALALGAQGVVLGTRFLSAVEANNHPGYRNAVIAARDGGQVTVRSKVFDVLKGPNQWPGPYDGRSLLNETWKDHKGGVDLEEIREKFKSAIKAEDAGYADDGTGRATMWAGTGVGLVRREQPAAEIVEEVREGAIAALTSAKSLL